MLGEEGLPGAWAGPLITSALGGSAHARVKQHPSHMFANGRFSRPLPQGQLCLGLPPETARCGAFCSPCQDPLLGAILLTRAPHSPASLLPGLPACFWSHHTGITCPVGQQWEKERVFW